MSTKLTRENFKGPWAGLPVAWNKSFGFDKESYSKDVENSCKAGFPGVYTGGTTGEFYAMEFDEFSKVAAVTVEICKGNNVPVMIGCTSTYTIGAVKRAKYAADIGADAVQVALPYWMSVGDNEVTEYFEEVASAAPDLALSVYETRRAKKTLTLNQHIELKRRIPQYLMVKANDETLGDSPAGCADLSSIVNVFVSENRWAELGPHGAAGSCSSLIYWLSRFTMRAWNDVEAKNWNAVNKAAEAMDALFNFLGVQFANRGFTDAAYDKMGGAIKNFLSGSLICRHPYPYGNESDVKALREWIGKNYPEMLQ